MSSYYFGDLKTQEEILMRQLIHAPVDVQMEALKRLNKRVIKFYGLKNKFKGNGEARY